MIFKELLVMPSPVFFQETVYHTKKEEERIQEFPVVAAEKSVVLTTNNRQYDTSSGVWQDLDVDETRVIKQSVVLNLFLTSKKIYSEAAPIYFGNNIFRFNHLDRFEFFLSNISAEARCHVSIPHQPLFVCISNLLSCLVSKWHGAPKAVPPAAELRCYYDNVLHSVNLP